MKPISPSGTKIILKIFPIVGHASEVHRAWQPCKLITSGIEPVIYPGPYLILVKVLVKVAPGPVHIKGLVKCLYINAHLRQPLRCVPYAGFRRFS